MSGKVQQSTFKEYSQILDSTVESVNARVSSVLKKFGINYDTVYDYLRNNELELIRAQEAAEIQSNTDILGRIYEGTASIAECISWKRSIAKWRKLVILGMDRYENFQDLSDVA